MGAKNLRFFILVLLIVGASGIIAQTVLLREMLILFSGNEFSIGVIIGSWVIWEAIGAFMGGKWPARNRENIAPFLLAICLFALLFPVSVYLTRVFKIIAGIPPEIGVGILPILYASFLILFPTGFLHGYLFTLASSIHNQMTRGGPSSIGKVYFYETLGTIMGGLVVSYLFIPYYDSFRIAIGTTLLTGVTCLLFIPTIRQETAVSISRMYGSRRLVVRLTFLLAILLSMLSAGLLVSRGTDTIHRASIQTQWKGKQVVHYENSFYQNIVVVQNEDQYTFFSGGIPFITIPVPDITFVEEFVHYPLLSHPFPENVLVLSGGAGGVISEILKYPSVKTIDYVEIDPVLLKTIKRFAVPLTEQELGSSLVNLHYMDSKIFVRRTQARYDVVLLGAPVPHTLQTNRFFTREFFAGVKDILKDKGIFALTMPGSLAYYPKELKELNACILQTLGSVFPFLFVLPGDYNLFIASKADTLSHISPALLYERLGKQHISTRLITLPHLQYRLEERWREWLSSNLKNVNTQANRDFSPMGLFYSIAYDNLLFSPALKTVFEHIQRINLSSTLILLSILFLVLLVLSRRYRTISLSFAIGTTGFTAMILELALIFGFQIFCGYVFYEIGILLTAFMGGLALGSLTITWRLDNLRREMALFKGIETAIAFFSFSLFLLFYLLDPLLSSGSGFVRLLFLALLFISGFLTGIEFPLACKIYLKWKSGPGFKDSVTVGETVGLLYGVDLMGGWIGGVMGGLILLPVLGLLKGCIMLAFLKVCSLLLLWTFPRK